MYRKKTKDVEIREKGITLIALIITIIVLLILAGVTIAILTGDNGILTKTGDARNTSLDAENMEKIKLAYQDYYLGKHTQSGYTLKNALDKMFGENEVEVTGEGPWTIKIGNKTYTLELDGTTELYGTTELDGTLNPNSVQALAQSGAIQLWDRVNYNPGSGTTAGINLPDGASLCYYDETNNNVVNGGTITANSASDWVVIDVNQTTGEVLIMPKTVSDVALRLEGKDGYNNAIQAINTVASIYKNPTYATSARGLTIEDVNKLTGYTPDGLERSVSWYHKYGMDSNNLNITGGEGSIESNQTYTCTAESGWYAYFAHSVLGSNNHCWLASRAVDVENSEVTFNVRSLCGGNKWQRGGGVYPCEMFTVKKDGNTSSNDSGDKEHEVVPVVSLKSSIGLESSSRFYTKTATATVSVQEQDETHTFEHNVWTLK